MKVSELIVELQKTLESGSDYSVHDYEHEWSRVGDEIEYVKVEKEHNRVVLAEWPYNEP
jgi:hypothetical protein